MSKKLLVNLLPVFLLFLSSVTVAGDWSAWGTIERVSVPQTYGQGRAFYVKLAGISTADNCNESTWAVGDINEENVDRQYSLLLAAFMSGKQLKVYTEGCIWYPRIVTVEVK